jgi:hypothetical protein
MTRLAPRAAAALLALVALPAAAEEIFWDGFDQGDFCAWSNPPIAITVEDEAYNQTRNDTQQSADPIGRCAIVDGTIGEFDVDAPDIDYYEIDATGPMLLSIRLERRGAGSDFQPFATVEYESSFLQFGFTPPGTPSNDPTSVTRQIYLPENGFDFEDPPETGNKDVPANNEWYVVVEDDRNYTDPACPCGGQGNDYRLTIGVEPVAGPNAVAGNEQSVTMPADGSVRIFRLDGAVVSTLDVMETIEDQLAPGLGELDTKIYVVAKSSGGLVTVAGNDDWAIDGFGDLLHKDSELEGVALDPVPHFLLVDYFEKVVASGAEIELDLQYFESSP